MNTVVENRLSPTWTPRGASRLLLRLQSLGLDFIYLLLLVLLLPWLAYLILVKGRGVGSFPERLGRSPVLPPAEGRIWVHAVSVGEVEAAVPLIHELEAAGAEVVVSTTTTTAQELAKKRFDGRPVFLFPIDAGWCVRRTLRRVRPNLILLVELELWPNLVLNSTLLGVPIVVANGRVSERGFGRMSRFRFVLAPFFRRLDRVLVQNEEYRDRLEQLGVEPSRLEVTGNLKFDRPALENVAEDRARFDQDWGFGSGRPRWIAGCTHPGEEEKVLAAHSALRERFPDLALILAPRHVERSAEVLRLAESCAKGAVARFSSGPAEPPEPGPEILVVDVTGELATLYACADVAFVGGSLIPRGGHNILEPVLAGTPALHGPFTGNFRQIVRVLTGGDATVEVENVEALVERLGEWLGDAAERKARRDLGLQILATHRGAARRSAERILAAVPAR